jgi:hypothetical protein
MRAVFALLALAAALSVTACVEGTKRLGWGFGHEERRGLPQPRGRTVVSP